MKRPILNLMLFASLTFALTSCGGSEEQIEEVTEVIEETAEEVSEEPAYDGKTFVFVMAEVEDFDKWQTVYKEKSDPEGRLGHSVNADNEKMVGVAEFTKGHAAAKEKFASEKMKAAMAEAGVTSEPQFMYLNTVWMSEEKVPGAYHIAVTHEIAEMEKWRAAFDADKPNRESAGLNDICIATAEDNDNMVTVVLATDNMEACKVMFNDPKVGEMMKEAGVMGQPQTSYWKVMH